MQRCILTHNAPPLLRANSSTVVREPHGEEQVTLVTDPFKSFPTNIARSLPCQPREKSFPGWCKVQGYKGQAGPYPTPPQADLNGQLTGWAGGKGNDKEAAAHEQSCPFPGAQSMAAGPFCCVPTYSHA